jgi:signal transduction histidine kinase
MQVASARESRHGVALTSLQTRRPFLWVIALLVLLSIVLATYVPLAFYFVVAASALIPWATQGDVGRTVKLTIPLLLVLGIEIQLVPGFRHQAFSILTLVIIDVAGCIWVVKAGLRIRHLAEVMERHRITLDLRDALGHAMSQIRAKSGRVGYLLADSHQLEAAQSDVSDIEQLSRQTLAQIRTKIRGYRADLSGLAASNFFLPQIP